MQVGDLTLGKSWWFALSYRQSQEAARFLLFRSTFLYNNKSLNRSSALYQLCRGIKDGNKTPARYC
jgi:hypothetical protein